MHQDAHHLHDGRPSLILCCGLLAISIIGFADCFTYSLPDAFLGAFLRSKDSSLDEAETASQVMLAYGMEGSATVITVILVLLWQSMPATACGTRLPTKWSIVIIGQLIAVAASLMPVIWPLVAVVIGSRAMHGAATAVYMVYCLILLVELSPKHHLALGIATLSAGMVAGDSLGPMLGAEAYAKSGARAAFLLQTAVNMASLLGSLMLIPVWQLSPEHTRDELVVKAASFSQGLSWTLPVFTGKGDWSAWYKETPAPYGLPQPLIKNCVKASHVRKHGSSPGEGIWDIPAAKNMQNCQKTTLEGRSKSFPGLVSFVKTPAVAADLVHAPATAALSTVASSQSDLDNTSSQTLTDTTPKACVILVAMQKPPQPDVTDLSSTTSSDCSTNTVVSKLDIKVVFATLGDPVILRLCLLLALGQLAKSTITVVLPSAIGLPTWAVGLVYMADVAGSVSSPFAVDAILSMKGPSFRAHKLSAGLCMMMAVAGAALLPSSRSVAGLILTLMLYGAAQSAVETLIYVHVAERLETLGHETATHASMCMYLLAQTTGSALGSLAGGGLQMKGRLLQILVTGGVAGLSGLYGALLGLCMHRKVW